MRVIAQQWTSLDGYAAGRSGEEEIFAAVPEEADAASQRWNLELLDRVDHVLLGRRTYELFVQYWPGADGPIAARVNAIAKVVCSRSLGAAPWGGFAPARVVPDAAAHVRSLRDASDDVVLIWGSLSIVHQLLGAGQLDELDLFVAPVALGSGTPLLPAATRLRQLAVADLGGATHVRYATSPR
ncbi:dihydrofolate reductase family protein [Aeromicrobium choanae]|uniref:Dihydrofolate reductase n=1 Tax=Aeromicrobium choanae TaxID=1736691 RepID=A0A1T4Z605_9ACTN|nr:dihydrofolate reductase family protein [Aeromicrobium choanae]SKB09011.1 Dihydrofolate reductase [Aeromicrobium choanae]